MSMMIKAGGSKPFDKGAQVPKPSVFRASVFGIFIVVWGRSLVIGYLGPWGLQVQQFQEALDPANIEDTAFPAALRELPSMLWIAAPYSGCT